MEDVCNGCEREAQTDHAEETLHANLLPVLNPRIVGVSSVPTLNRVKLKSGEISFVHCGGDILLSGLFQDVEGDARCPFCGGSSRLEIKNSKIESLEPSSSLLHYVRFVTADPGSFGIMCESTFLFDKEACLNAWRQTYAGRTGIVATPQEFMEEVWLTRRKREILTK